MSSLYVLNTLFKAICYKNKKQINCAIKSEFPFVTL